MIGLTSDLAAFFNTADFAVLGSISRNGGIPIRVKGIFDNEGVILDLDGATGHETTQAVFACPSPPVAGVQHGDVLAIGSARYKVVEVLPDGAGVTRLALKVHDD